MTQKKKTIPEFKNREDEAKFFDTHDMADYQHEFKTLKINERLPFWRRCN